MKSFRQHLTELSKKTLGNYIKKSSSSRAGNAVWQGAKMATLSGEKGREEDTKHNKIDRKRADGIARAVKQITKEETMYNDKLIPSIGDAIAQVAAFDEAVEPIDELSKKTLGSYITKAARSTRASTSLGKEFERTANHHLAKAHNSEALAASGDTSYDHAGEAKHHRMGFEGNAHFEKEYKAQAGRRVNGIARAAAKLTREGMEHKHTHQVTYSEKGIPGHQYFHCTADDKEHAKEQCMDAYPNAKIHKITPSVEQVEEGIFKNIKRGLLGWDGKVHLAYIKNNVKTSSDASLVRLAKTEKETSDPKHSITKHSPRDLQTRLIHRELKKRYHAEETLVSENYEGMEHLSDAAHELVLHADNNSHLHHGSHMPIINNLKKKAHKGVYDSEKAKKLWGYHADRAAQSYHKEYGDKSQPWHKMFTTHDRRQAAEHFEAKHRDEVHEA